jgi:hypothetical protein
VAKALIKRDSADAEGMNVMVGLSRPVDRGIES